MTRALAALVVSACLVAASATPALAAGTPRRPDGPVVAVLPSQNGGDNGWGNCGHNSSGGTPPADGGNGGHRRAEGCADPRPTHPAPTDPAPTDPAPTDPAPTEPVIHV